jgi:hypothetical protein
MSLEDFGGEGIDPEYAQIIVLFNATSEQQSLALESVAGMPFTLHPVQVDGSDEIVKQSTFDQTSGTFTVPGRSTAVFVLNEPIVN